jgi:AcrR family transcriptional regulator
MRTIKEHNERQNEILDTAQKLFAEKGYGKCTVNDILNEIGIAKGTFYHYFKSKEEVLDAIIDRGAGQILERAQEAASNPSFSPEEKLYHVFMAIRMEEESDKMLIEEMHRMENALMHQKSLTSVVTLTVPLLAKVIEEGNKSGVFHCDYPEEYMQIFMASAVTLLDDGIFAFSQEQQQGIFRALIYTLGKMLGIDEKALWEKAAENWM